MDAGLGLFCPHDNPVENLRRAVYHEKKACAGMEEMEE